MRSSAGKGSLCAVLGEVSEVTPGTAARMFCCDASSSISVPWRMEEHTQRIKGREKYQENPHYKIGVSPFKVKLKYFLYSETGFSLMRTWRE